MAGNPVRIGGGCATVSSYKPPNTTGWKLGKAGVRFDARSQDTDPCALVGIVGAMIHFSVKEKDETSRF